MSVSICATEYPPPMAPAPSGTPAFTPGLYRELRRIAARHLQGQRPNHTLQPTALVHEAFLKLSRSPGCAIADDVHFLALASRVMRQVLVDYARARGSQKRFGEAVRSDLLDGDIEAKIDGPDLAQLVELDNALTSLAKEDEVLARLIEMRYFGGMTAEESAEMLGISAHVVRHDLRFAQAWLRRRMNA